MDKHAMTNSPLGETLAEENNFQNFRGA